jgi:hypothetical protein
MYDLGLLSEAKKEMQEQGLAPAAETQLVKTKLYCGSADGAATRAVNSIKTTIAPEKSQTTIF